MNLKSKNGLEYNKESTMDFKEGKRIFLMAPEFYGYEDRIVTALEKEGLAVCFEYIYKPSRSVRYLSKVSSGRYKKILDRYYDSIISKYDKTSFDYFLVVDGKGIPEGFLKKMVSNHPDALSVYYSWDSLQYFNYLSWMKIFDRIYTFDYKDSKEYGIKYLPLFYTPELEKVGENGEEKVYDLLFIASYKESRLNFINKVVDKYKDSLNIKVVLYLTIYRYIIDKFKGKRIRRSDVVFRPLPFEEYLELLSQTKVVLDYTAATQTGLPMRIPEAIGARKKLITNNENVRQEFNNSSNILVYKDDEDIRPFISSGMNDMKERENYSVNSWIRSMLS